MGTNGENVETRILSVPLVVWMEMEIDPVAEVEEGEEVPDDDAVAEAAMKAVNNLIDFGCIEGFDHPLTYCVGVQSYGVYLQQEFPQSIFQVCLDLVDGTYCDTISTWIAADDVDAARRHGMTQEAVYNAGCAGRTEELLQACSQQLKDPEFVYDEDKMDELRNDAVGRACRYYKFLSATEAVSVIGLDGNEHLILNAGLK